MTQTTMRRRPQVASPEDFVNAAAGGEGPPTSQSQQEPVHAKPDEPIYWGHPRIRKDFVLRLNEESHGKLTFILEHSHERSMHSLLMTAVNRLIDEGVEELVKAGYRPSQTPSSR